MYPRTATPDVPANAQGCAMAYSVKLSRNLLVQVVAVAMISTMGFTALPASYVAPWALAAIVALIAEDHALRMSVLRGPKAAYYAVAAPVLRLTLTSTYAIAAFALIVRGGPTQQLFAFTLISASMLYLLMRYFARPALLFLSISPYAVILAYLSGGEIREALAQGHWRTAVSACLTVATFGLMLFSVRGQLTGNWNELQRARREAEEREQAAQAANRAKSNFLAAMSHELRTPLNGVLGMAQALTTERLTRVQLERVKIIRRSGENLLSVLNDLLDLSKIETSAIELEISEFDLEHLIAGVAAAYQPMANRKQLTFTFEVSPEVAGRYLGDSARIRRVLYNLAENAVKFTDRGGVTVCVEKAGDAVAFKVRDTGIGIAPGDLTHLFDNFFQADASLARRHDGAGLGLAICRELVNLMGGAMEVESEVGQGSTFIACIPLTAAATAKSETKPSRGVQPEPTALRVLAAEDNATNQMVIKTLLAQVGIAPVIVGNGREALAAWERQDWDLILMDIQMPEMDGLAATRVIRERERETGRARTPIVAVTANAMSHQLAEYLAAGMELVVPKPIDATRLFASIEEALEMVQAPVRTRASA